MYRPLCLIFLFNFLCFAQNNKPEQSSDIQETLKEYFSLDDNFFTDIISKHVKQKLITYVKDNPFQSMQESEVQSYVIMALKQTPLKTMPEKFPKLITFITKWLKDKEAMPSAIQILNEEKKLKVYGIFAIVVFILFFILNLFSSGNILKRIINKIFLMFASTSFNLIAFGVIFQKELSPTFKVAKTVFL